jgi:archaellum component FlaG (FlaF/FlaG flagellin family)
MTAALLSFLGALLVMAIANLIATAFYAGRLTERVSGIDARVSILEASERETALEAARLGGRRRGDS